VSEAASCPPDLMLEEYLLGDLSPDSAYRSHITACERCTARLSAMRSTGEAYMKGEAAEQLRGRLRELDKARAHGRRSLWWWSAVAPLAAAAAWFALYRAPQPGDLVAKGGTTVELFVGHEGRVLPWTGGALAPGDALQLSWTSATAGYVAVIGRDEKGGTVRWFPSDDPASRLEPGTRTFGDSLRFDSQFSGTIYVLVADGPFSTRPLEEAIREGRDPAFRGETLELRVPHTP
jgi:hypothetical protein